MLSRPPDATGGEKSAGCEPRIDDGVRWRADWLPAGFELVSAGREGGETAMVYSDGLSFVSVFINPDGEPAFPPIQAQRHGCTNVQGQP